MTPYFEADGVTLYLGDCLEVMAGMAAGSVDAIITDPPYGSNDGLGKVTKRGNTIVDFGESWDATLPLEWIALGFLAMRDGGWVSVFTDKLSVNTLWQKMLEVGLHPKHTFYWVKSNPTPQPRKNFCSSVESAVVATKGPVKVWNGGGVTPNFFVHPITGGAERTAHPTQKPEALIIHLVQLQSNLCDLICDPFTGSGTTAIAAIRTGRRFVGAELEERYCEIAARRIERELQQPRLFTEAAQTDKYKTQSLFDINTEVINEPQR